MAQSLEKAIGYTFKNKNILRTALTHTSYANETREKVEHNQRMEFLGDSVLQIVSAEHLYNAYEKRPEGDLTRIRATLVSENALFQFAKEIELGKYLLLGKGEEHSGGRERSSTLADAFEALIAAVYLDGGMDNAKKFVLRFITEGKHAPTDYKTKLQEIVQQNPEEHLSYHLEEEIGPAHDREFVAAVYLNSNCLARGTAKSKKGAEQLAAKEALRLMGVAEE